MDAVTSFACAAATFSAWYFLARALQDAYDEYDTRRYWKRVSEELYAEYEREFAEKFPNTVVSVRLTPDACWDMPSGERVPVLRRP